MSLSKTILNVIIVCFVWILVLSGCTDSSDGVVALNLSDSPIDAANVDGVNITINSIEYHRNGVWETAPGFAGPTAYNLLTLTNGETALLGNLIMPGGQYSQIRFMLDITETGQGTPSNPGCYLSFSDETPDEPLFVPSGSESGFKATGAFTVPVNGTVELTADFDVRKGVINWGECYVLQPTIRLVVTGEAGSIGGGVTNSSAYTDIIVFAYADGAYADSEDDDPALMAVRFPNAIVSARACDVEGLQYKLCFLAAGIYDLAVAGYNGDVFGAVLGFVPDVEVISSQLTSEPIDTAALAGSL